VQDAANARTADKLATIEISIGQIGRRLLGLTQQFLTGEAVARIIGRDGEPVWIRYDRDYIAGDFDFDVVGGSTRPNNESFKRAQTAEMIQAMAPFASAGVIDMAKFAAYVLQTGFGIKNPESFLSMPEPPPAPMEIGTGAGLPPEAMMPMGPPAEPMMAPGGVSPETLPPEILAQLLAQAGGGAPPMGGVAPPPMI
jgi:hypothetical protein